MKRKPLLFIAFALILASLLLTVGCNGKLNMVTGRWKFLTTGDENGNNQQQSQLPIVMAFDVYPDGRVDIVLGDTESEFGRYTMDRDLFTFVGSDKEAPMNESGSFVINANATTDPSTGNSVTTITLYLDDQPESVVLQKVGDYAALVAYKKAQASAARASAAAAATLAPMASAKPTAS